MKKIRIMTVVGTRPEIIRLSRVIVSERTGPRKHKIRSGWSFSAQEHGDAYFGSICISRRRRAIFGSAHASPSVSTERLVTAEEGTNTLVGITKNIILRAYAAFRAGKRKTDRVPDLWDGRATARILDILLKTPLYP